MFKGFGKKNKRPCKFCREEKAVKMKEFNDYFCTNCKRFQSGEEGDGTTLLPIMKLQTYTIVAQKIQYIVLDSLGSKIAYCEKRNINKFVDNPELGARFCFFNQANRLIATIDGSNKRDLSNLDLIWQVYDYGRNLRGTVQYFFESDHWCILNPEGTVIAERNPKDLTSKHKALRNFHFMAADNKEKMLFSVKRKTNFELEIQEKTFDAHLAWAVIIAIHRKYL